MKKKLLVLLCLLSIFNLTAQTIVTVGTASVVSGNQDSSPINIFYRSHHCQILYTPAEINSGGWLTAGIISKIGFNIFSTTSEALPNFTIKLKNTTSLNVENYDPTGLNLVYTSASYFPTAGGFELLTLDNNFIWDGTSNLLVDVCFDQVSAYTSTGQVYLYPYDSSLGTHYAHVRADNAPVCGDPTSSTLGGKSQIQFELSPLPPCTGLPTAGDAVSTSTNICANNPFSLSLINNSVESGLEYQWQSSPNGTVWTNLGSVQLTPLMSFSSLPATTYYQCVTTCTSSATSATSTPVMVALNPLLNCYCTINAANGNNVDCTQDKIVDFSIANVISQTTNCDAYGYSDSTASNYTSINLAGGNTYTLTANTLLSGFNGNGMVGAWIDYNQNATFDSNEFISLGSGPSGTYSNTFVVPITVNAGAVRMRMVLNAYYTYAGTILYPCSGNPSIGQVVDYKVNLTPAPPCSAAPNAGDATSSTYNVCSAESYTLNLVNNDAVSGLTYQWQSSANGTVWTNLGSAQNTIEYVVASQSSATHYRCITTCTSSVLTGTSTAIVVNQNDAYNCLCTPESISCSSSQITNLAFENINHAPACSTGVGYVDYMSLATVSLTANQTYSIAIDLNCQGGIGYTGLWIDYNNDGTFDANEYTYVGSLAFGTLTTNISVPYTAVGGLTAMRVKMESTFGSFGGLDPCTANEYSGHTLDYLLNITPAPPCSGTPNAGDATAPANICSNTAFTLNLANNDMVSNVSYQWQSSPDNVMWTNLGALQMVVPYVVTNQTVTTYYRCITTCTTSALSGTSTPVSVTQNNYTACYCIPSPAMDCSTGNEINYVALATLTNTSACDGVGGYSDFTGTVSSSTVSAGQSYTLAVRVGSTFGQHAYSWIDYNQNGIFEPSEYTDYGLNSGNDTIKGTINIPVTALPGNTRMRIRNFSGQPLSPNDACYTPTGGVERIGNTTQQTLGTGSVYGETEDYLITILPPDCGMINFPPSFTVTGTTDICPTQSTTLDITPTVQAATGVTYEWYYFNGSSYVSTGSPSAVSQYIDAPAANTLYYCEVQCNASPVRNSDTVNVKIHTITTAPVATNATCNGLNNGSIAVNGSGAGTTLSYSWTPNVGSTDVVTNLNAGTYTVLITNSYSCAITETISVTEPTPIIATTSQTNVSCYGLSDGAASVLVTGGSAPYFYSWTPFAGSGSDATNLSAGNYSVSITDANGCVIMEGVTITQPSQILATISSSATVICEQLEDTLTSSVSGGLAPYTYNWVQLPSTNVSSNPNYTYTTSVGTFSYGLTVTDATNCTVNSNTLSITGNPSSNISGTVTTNTITPVAGRVILYKYLPIYTQFDSVAGQNLGASGDYNFTSFTSGKYIVKAIPSAPNMQIAYGDTAVNWKTAKQIIHGCAVNDIQNIEIKSMPTFTPGPGMLTGIITETVGYGTRPFGSSNNDGNAFRPTVPGTPIGGIVVKGGKNPGGQMMVQTTTQSSGPGIGTYTLSGLPYGDYFVLVDITGLDTNQTYHVKIAPGNTVFHNLDFTVDSIQINPLYSIDVKVHDIESENYKISVFPNPATNHVTVKYSLQNNSSVKVELYDILGKSVKTLLPTTQQNADNYKSTWYLDDLRSGLYFIKININGVENTIKLSVTN